MSRVGKMPIVLPQGVEVTITAEQIIVKGSAGTLVRPVNSLVTVKNDSGKLLFASGASRQDFERVDFKPYANGVIVVRYRRKGRTG